MDVIIMVNINKKIIFINFKGEIQIKDLIFLNE